MKYVFPFLFLLMYARAQAQYGFSIVQDPKDAYVNVRKGPGTNYEVSFKLDTGTVVYMLDGKDGWVEVIFNSMLHDDTNSGYIYLSRLREIADYSQTKKLHSTADSVAFRYQDVTVGVGRNLFIPKAHRIKYGPEGRWVKSIDGGPVWGQDGGMPQYQYKNITYTWKGETRQLPDSALANLYEPTLYKTSVHYDAANERIFIIASNSDGAGGYEAVWVIEHGEYKRRAVFHGF